MKNLLRIALAGFAALSFTAHAEGKLNSFYTVNIDVPASTAWDAVKDFNGLHKWHHMFSGADIKSGTNNVVGAIRTLTLQDGPSFDEELLEWNDLERTFTYRVIDPAPLPIKSYVSTMQVMQLSPGVSTVIWRSAYENGSNGEVPDDEVIALLNGAYKMGLDSLKIDLE